MVRTLQELSELLDCELQGDASCEISGVGTLERAKPGEITFLANKKYRGYLETTQASAVILGVDEATGYTGNALISNNPYLTYARTVAVLNPEAVASGTVHPTAVIEEGVLIAEGASIGPNCFVGAGVKIGAGVDIGPGCVVERGVTVGDQTRLVANVTLCREVVIGSNCLIHPGAVVGSDGFGFANDKGIWVKIPQIGSVVVGDNVEIGANTTIDRGALEDTEIEEGVKLDNQIQVAHNVRIGAHSAVAGCTGIAGSTTIGKRCQIGGAAVVVGHLNIVDDVHITAMAFVTGNIKVPGVYSSGVPAGPRKEWKKNAVRARQLNDIVMRLKAVEKLLEEK